MKKLTLTAISAVMTASLFSAPVLAEEAVAATGTQVYYGFSVQTPDDENISVDYRLSGDADGKAALSADVTITEGEDSISIPLQDLLIGDEENLYLNANTLASAYETVSGQSVAEALPQLGITEEWVALPAPEVDKITAAEAAAPASQISVDPQAVLQDLLPVVVDFMPATDADGNTTISVDRAKLLSAAQNIDTVIAKYAADLDLSSLAAANPLQGLDIKPAIEKYINAVAEGYVQANPDTTVEDAAAMFGNMIDSALEEAFSQFNVAFDQAADLSASASVSLYDLLNAALADTDFAASVTYGSAGVTVNFTLNGQPIVLTAGLAENGIALTLGDGTNVYYTGAITMTETGMALSVVDAQQNELLTGELIMQENAYILTVASGETEVLNLTLAQTEAGAALTLSTVALPDSLTLSYELADDNSIVLSAYYGDTYLYASLGGQFSDTEGDGSIYLAAGEGEESATFYGYINYAAADDVVIEIPTACDGLEVIKNISYMYFASQSAEATEATAETE